MVEGQKQHNLSYVITSTGRVNWMCVSWFPSTLSCSQRLLRSHAATLLCMSLQILTNWLREIKKKCCTAKSSSLGIWKRYVKFKTGTCLHRFFSRSTCKVSLSCGYDGRFCFFDFPQQVRSTEVVNGCREDVDTALLKLYAEQHHESLMELLTSDNSCLLADSIPWLEKHHKWETWVFDD